MIKLKTLIEQEVKKADYSMELHFDHIDNLTDKIEKQEAQKILKSAKSHRLKAKLSRGMGGRGYELDITNSNPQDILKFLINPKDNIFPRSQKKYAAELISTHNDDDFEYTSKGKFEMI